MIKQVKVLYTMINFLTILKEIEFGNIYFGTPWDFNLTIMSYFFKVN